MGLDPPQMRHVEGLSLERTEENEEHQTLEELQESGLVVTSEMAQPWDDETIEKEKETGGDDSEGEKDKQEEIINENESETPAYQIKLEVKIPPRIRTTRQAEASTGSTVRPIAKLMGYKVNKNGDELFRVLCEGDKPGYAFWTGRDTILSSHNSNTEVENELELFKDIWESKIRARREQGASSGPIDFTSDLQPTETQE